MLQPPNNPLPTKSVSATRALSGAKKSAKQRRQEIIAACAIACCGLTATASAVSDTDATTAYNAFNSAFLNTTGNGYVTHLGDTTTYDYFWSQAEEIELIIDRYERTKGTAEKSKITTLCDYFVSHYPNSGISGDTWNDDLGRVAEMLMRAYFVTGSQSYLDKAKFCFDTAYQRGWDTTSNGGGIWEQQGVANPRKEALSTLSCGYAAAMIYQATGSQGYRSHAGDIYAWARSNIYVASTGEVYHAVYPDGTFDKSPGPSTQGMWIDYANTLYKISSNTQYLNDAMLAVTYTKANLTDSNGIIVSGDAKFSRGLGHLVVQQNLWNTTFASGTTYYSWMWSNCNTGWGQRRTDLNIASNQMTNPTPTGADTSHSPWWWEAVPSLLQYTFTPH